MSIRTPAVEEIMELEREACRLIQAGEVDRLADIIIAEDGLLFADGGDTVTGKEAQRVMFKEVINAGIEIKFEPTNAFVSNSEDMAWAYGTYEVKMPNGAEDVGSYVSVWEKISGKWKNVAEMRNSNIPR